MGEYGAALSASLVLGLLGSGHCLGMCGGIVAALSMQAPTSGYAKPAWHILFAYHLGRIATYTFMAASLAFGLQLSTQWIPQAPFPVARTVAGILLIAMGLYVGRWWQGLRHLEQLGLGLWRRIKPWGDGYLPANTIGKALLVGAIWGWLPCGLIYSTLAYALAQKQPLLSALCMAAFGLGTLPALFLGSVFASHLQRFFHQSWLRNLLAVAYIIFGVWTVLIAWQHHGHHHGDHAHHHGHHQH